MPIEFACNSCGKRLRVKDAAAGKRVKCPGCQAVLRVPGGGAAAPAAPAAQPTASAPAAAEMWYAKTEDEQTYGPVSRQELDEWATEGRLTADSQILREGASQWQWATDLYPQLSQPQQPAPAAPGPATPGPAGGSSNPFDFAAAGSPAPQAAPENPFDFAAADSRRTGSGGGPIAAPSGVARRGAARGRGRRTNPKIFKNLFFTYLGCPVLGSVIVVISSLLASQLGEVVALVGLGLAVIVLICGPIAGFMWLYKAWELIQDGRARTQPLQAALLMLIPFFNIYWMFVAFAGLAQDLNHYANERGYKIRQANEDLAMWTCYAFIGCVVPCVGALALPVLAILGLMSIWSVTQAAESLAAAKNRG